MGIPFWMLVNDVAMRVRRVLLDFRGWRCFVACRLLSVVLEIASILIWNWQCEVLWIRSWMSCHYVSVELLLSRPNLLRRNDVNIEPSWKNIMWTSRLAGALLEKV